MARRSKKKTPELYTEEQLSKIEEHIEKYFGQIENYYQEKDTDDIKLNIYIIPPSVERRHLTLVTAGMGAHEMNVPESLSDQKLTRAELAISLPPSWKLDSDDIEYYWPLHLIKLLSRLPLEENAWLGWGHTVDYCSSFAPNTDFSGVILTNPPFGNESCVCKLSDDEEVNFYQIIPLYSSEIAFKNKNGASALLGELSGEYSYIVDTDRSPAVPDDFGNIIDRVDDHSFKIEEKDLDLPDIYGANHIAAFFRWAMEHDLLCDEFTEFFADELPLLRKGKYDIRRFIINSLGGELTMDILTEQGQAFAEFYYDFYCEPPSYPDDVDKMAEAYFGTEKYNCEEFADEAYLFVPFNDDYFSAMYRYIDHAYSDFCYYQEHGKLPDEE